MADSRFDEDKLIEMLQTKPINENTIPVLQNACAMALADLYDRRASVDYVMQHAHCILSTYAMLSRTWLLGSIHELFDAGTLTEHSFTQAREQITAMATEQTEAIVAMLNELKPCPTSPDTVH